MNLGFLHDYLGNKSNGRLLASACVILAFMCWWGGYTKPEISAHSIAGMNAFLLAGGVFYGVAKTPETVATAKNKQEDKGE